jgi:hypothetical protein
MHLVNLKESFPFHLGTLKDQTYLPFWDITVMARKKVRPPGIEPGPEAWEASVLPLDYERL